MIERVVAPNGRAVRFDGEVTSVDRNSSGSDAVTRGAIGAGIGALIGALAGGGKGAIIGAAIGGGGAAATVLFDDPDQPQLLRGTQFISARATDREKSIYRFIDLSIYWIVESNRSIDRSVNTLPSSYHLCHPRRSAQR